MINVPCIKVGIQFVAPDGTNIGDLIRARAVLANDWYAMRERCSGQALWSIFFTANAPHAIGNGELIVGTHKSVVMSNLRARPLALGP